MDRGIEMVRSGEVREEWVRKPPPLTFARVVRGTSTRGQRGGANSGMRDKNEV